MKIITAPHEGLRTKAKSVKRIDKKLYKFITQLQATLKGKDKPAGVGLAAPQVNKAWRIFTTNISPEGSRDISRVNIKVFINPIMTKHDKKLSFGPDEKHPTLEGCLSIKSIYGPVPRYAWVKFEWQELENEKLVNKKGHFEHFAARVMQHELDHLNGILFTDYSLDYDLPIYQESDDGKKLVEVKNKSVLEMF
ncbi:MAG: peptide deformylase [Patescibacteria group bacterium]